MDSPRHTTDRMSSYDAPHSPQALPAQTYPLDALLARTLRALEPKGASSAQDASDDQTLDPDALALPSWERVRVPAKTLADLQWDQLIAHLRAHAVSREGQALAEATSPLQDERAVARRMREISEGQLLHQSDERPPLRGLSDIRRALAHVQRGGWLVGEDLYAISQNCDVAARVARFYHSRAEVAPHLAEAAARLDACDALRHALNIAVEPDGALSDKASPDLARLRRAVHNQHERVRAYLERALREQAGQTLQDDYYTIREDRYVLPVRRSNKADVPGIVHGYSSSGQTAYIEPTELIELNNQLRWAQIELQEEEERILKRLSELVARHARELSASADLLAYLDYLNAAAKLAMQLRCTIPDLDATRVQLKGARHPLLALRPHDQVTPNELRLDPERQVLVISGPNTGGKTVLLKTLGLCALMARCGMPLPVEEGSGLPLFRAIFTDIGDDQSIERDLSTFSGHLTNINTFIDDCSQQTLVLLDELFTGTDPMQGAALAASLLEELVLRGSRVVVTTHLESLKTLAFQRSAYANASMGFDLESLSPTYQVTYGLPGSSYALRIAQRLGLPQVIIDRAKRIMDGQEHQSVEEILSSLEDKRLEVEAEQRRLAHERRQAEQVRHKFQAKYDKLVAREKELVHEQTKRVKADLERAQTLIRDQIKRLREDATRTSATQSELDKLRQTLAPAQEAIERAQDFARPVDPGPAGLVPVAPDELTDGLEVYIHSFKRKGLILGDQRHRKEVRVQLGHLKASVLASELFYPHEAARRAHLRSDAPRTPEHAPPPAPPRPDDPELLLPQNSNNTCDLRGMHVEAALEKLELFLDAASMSDSGGLYVIHGHGSGVLKRAVRSALPTSPYVRRFRRGEHGEGGDGVTIVFLRPHA